MGETGATTAAVIFGRLPDGHGELRTYRRPGPPEHLAFEVLREADGRAWTLRVPWPARAALRRLLGDARRALAGDQAPAFDDQGCAELAQATLGPGDGLLAVLLRQGDERAFALWRRELGPRGWGWTLDVVVVPDGLAAELAALMLAALDRLEG